MTTLSQVEGCGAWLFQVRRNLENDNPETRASGAALLRVMLPKSECVVTIPLLLQCIKFEMVQTREEAAGALLQLTLNRECLDDMSKGIFISDMIFHFSSNGSMVVRERCSGVLAVLARTSSKHRTKIVNNDGIEALLESLKAHYPDKLVDNILQTLQYLCVEDKARKAFAEALLADILADIIRGHGNFHVGARRRAFSMLATLNKTPEGAQRRPFAGIDTLTTEQVCVYVSIYIYIYI